jgi:uncharacterized protein (TIGR02996 family)
MIAADPFLQTILEQPEADAPRLVYADWLEEQGDPLAEMVRVQCELARLDDGHPRRIPLKIREDELRTTYESSWIGPVKELGLDGKFSRGLLEVSITGAQTLLDVGQRLFALPWVTYVKLSDGALDHGTLRALARSRWLARVHDLNLNRSHLTNEGIQILADSPYLGRLSKLNLSHTNIATKGVRLLIQSFDLSLLTELRLHFNGIAEGGARHLAYCSKLSRLRVLDLADNQLHNIGAEYLAESPFLNHLLSLDVRGNNIGLSGKRSLRSRFGPRVHLNNNIDYSF